MIFKTCLYYLVGMFYKKTNHGTEKFSQIFDIMS